VTSFAEVTGRLDIAADSGPFTLTAQADRIDLLDDGRVTIIDYKTGEHLAADREAFLDQEQARYRVQLETYGRILRLFEDRPIRLALYFPLFPAWRVWDFPD